MRVEASNQIANPHRLIFEGQQEIEVVRTAYIEYAYSLDMEGQSSSVTKFDRSIAKWSRDDPIKKIVVMERSLITARPELVVRKLYDVYENTSAVVEDMAESITAFANSDQLKARMSGVQWRQILGVRALSLAEVTEFKLSEYVVEDMATIDLDAEFARILAPKQLE